MIVIYQGIVHPNKDRPTNRLDLFNEFIVLLCTQYVILFTDYTNIDI